ncbi:PEP-CTERM sorting domain-containing protein [Dongia sp.]|uniref:PEP-CTERM sorting domain-containing protein n=1 Tax=Dongia sp. TaxID=1977262 RepID=UPI0037517F97
MIRRLLLAIAGIVLLAGAARPAAATTMDYTVTISAWDFTDVLGGADPLPAPAVLAEFKFTADLVNFASGAVDASFINLNVGTLGYRYFFDQLRIGGLANGAGVNGIHVGTDDLVFDISNFSLGGFQPIYAMYMQAGYGGLYETYHGIAHITATPVAVATTPLPAALPLFLSAIGGMGYLGWRRRKSAAA